MKPTNTSNALDANIKNRLISEVIRFTRPTSEARKDTSGEDCLIPALTVKGGCLKFHWSLSNPRSYTPRQNFLSQFINLKSDGDICKFAERYGPLNERDTPEHVDEWREWVTVACAIVDSGESLTRGRVGSIGNWRILHAWNNPPRRVRFPAPTNPPRGNFPEKEHVLWRSIVVLSLRKWITQFGGASLGVDWSGKLPRIKPNPPRSPGVYLGLAMVEWIGRPGVDTSRCIHCGNRFRRRTNATYCPDCRKSGIPVRERKCRQRERDKAKRKG
jgi:hypothetical protein